MKPKQSLFSALLVCCMSCVAGAITSDGRGIFPVVVQIRNEAGEPLRGVMVRLLDSGKPDPKSITDTGLRRLMDALEQPVRTDALGSALVYYYGGWSLSSSAGRAESYRRELRGRLVVTASGFVPTEMNVAQESAVVISRDLAPIVTVTLRRPETP